LVSRRFPFNTGCLPLNYRSNPGVNGVSDRGNARGSDGRSTRSDLQKFYTGVDFSELLTDVDMMWTHKEDEDDEKACRDRSRV